MGMQRCYHNPPVGPPGLPELSTGASFLASNSGSMGTKGEPGAEEAPEDGGVAADDFDGEAFAFPVENSRRIIAAAEL